MPDCSHEWGKVNNSRQGTTVIHVCCIQLQRLIIFSWNCRQFFFSSILSSSFQTLCNHFNTVYFLLRIKRLPWCEKQLLAPHFDVLPSFLPFFSHSYHALPVTWRRFTCSFKLRPSADQVLLRYIACWFHWMPCNNLNSANAGWILFVLYCPNDNFSHVKFGSLSPRKSSSDKVALPNFNP